MHNLVCTGWWEQAGLGQQPMHALRMTFAETAISGQGHDLVGAFTISGTLIHGCVTLKKQYLKAHTVNYSGTFDGEGTLQGMWSIHGIGGRWLIRVVAVDATSLDIQDL